MSPSPPPPGGTGRPGRKLGPIADSAGPTHRAWLEQVRESYQASGMTLQELERTTGWSRSKISELLRAAGRYPRWEFIRALLNALGCPAKSVLALRNLWVRAAQEADKRTRWINDCVLKELDPDEPPVDFTGFQVAHERFYRLYAGTLLRRPAQASRAVDDVFNLLLIIWDEALASANVPHFAWQMLRGTVLERAPHPDGHPALADAAFATRALHDGPSEARMDQLTESLALFDAIRRLPPAQLDVVILLHLRGLDEQTVADVMGMPLPAMRATARHARRTLTFRLFPSSRPTQEGPLDDRDD